MRPPHLRQTLTSTAKTRARSFAQPSRRGRGEASVGALEVSFAAAVRSSASWSSGIAAAGGMTRARRCWGGNLGGDLGLGHKTPIGDDPGEMPPPPVPVF
jgi:hypothetical protein